MKEYKFYLPLKLNNGKTVNKSAWLLVEKQLIESFGGFTCAGIVQGQWQSESGKIYKDHNKSFLIASKGKQKIVSFLKKVNSIFLQESYYLAQVSNSVDFINPKM